MEIIRITVGGIQENVYIYYDLAARTGVVIDPGAEPARVWAAAQKAGLTISAIILTHGHCDHIGGVDGLLACADVPVYAARDEKKLLGSAVLNGSVRIMGQAMEIKEYRPLDDGDTIQAGAGVLRVITTPGHTAGSICLYDETAKVLFSGDTLFRVSVGRTDLPTGDGDTLVSSIQDKLYTLPDDTQVYPGHGFQTTIGYEKANNPYIAGRGE